MIKTKNTSVNSPNYIAYNQTVTEETVGDGQPAGCYVEMENKGFIFHDETFEIIHPNATVPGILVTMVN